MNNLEALEELVELTMTFAPWLRLSGQMVGEFGGPVQWALSNAELRLLGFAPHYEPVPEEAILPTLVAYYALITAGHGISIPALLASIEERTEEEYEEARRYSGDSDIVEEKRARLNRVVAVRKWWDKAIRPLLLDPKWKGTTGVAYPEVLPWIEVAERARATQL